MGLNAEITALQKRINESDESGTLTKLSHQIERFTYLAWALVFIGLGFFTYGFHQYLFVHNLPYRRSLSINELGDYWGGSAGSFWALAGLFFIYVAFLGQKHQLLVQQMELMQSKLELMYTRKQLKGQKKQLRAQSLTLSQQRFENTFFQLFAVLRDTVNSMDLQVGNSVKRTGKDVFKSIYREMRKELVSEVSQKDKKVISIDVAHRVYLKIFSTYQSDLGHYFRTLYNVILYVHEHQDINDDQKKKYIRFVRAQLSNDELALLLYNGLSKFGREKLKPLIEEYNLLDNLLDDYLPDASHKKEYKNFQKHE